MACCIFTAYCMTRLIKACELLDVQLFKIQYNEFDDGPAGPTLGKDDDVVATKLALDGLTCTACVSAVHDAISAVPGVERISISLPLNRATVVHDQTQASTSDIIAAIDAKGYQATVGERTAKENAELLQRTAEFDELKQSFERSSLASFAIYVLESLARFDALTDLKSSLCTSAALLGLWVMMYHARRMHLSALRRARSLSMDSLISLSLAMSVTLSVFNTMLFGQDYAKVYWSSGSFLTMVILGGRFLDMTLRRRSAATFASLYRLQEGCLYANLIRRHDDKADGGKKLEGRVNAMVLRPRDEILIDAGSLIPCDSYVLAGESLVDESSMTGEHQAVLKRAGDRLMSGTLNLSSQISAAVSRTQEESALEEMISSIGSATESSNQDAMVDIMTSRFVQMVLAITLSSFIWTMFTSEDVASGFERLNVACERAMAVLASACPCALGLATPSAIMAGLDAAWVRGIIVSGGHDTFTRMAKLTHIVLDKTGTLTTGKLSVFNPVDVLEPQHRLLIAIAERDAARTHPVAQAVFRWAIVSLDEAARRQVSSAEMRALDQNFAGVTCEIQIDELSEWHAVHLGNAQFFDETGVDFPRNADETRSQGSGTTVHIAIDNKYVGSLRLLDTIRPEAPSVVRRLRDEYHLALAMLTGDVEAEAQRVSESLQIEVVSCQTLPSQKKAYIQTCRTGSAGRIVAMVGDGLNDAAALSASDVGIYLSPGLSVATSPSASTNMQISNVIITSPSLSRIPELLDIAKKTVRQAKWNVWWAIAYNACAVALALGAAEPWGFKVDAAMAGTMMSASSVSVMAWSLWLRRTLQTSSASSPSGGNRVDETFKK